MKASFRLIVAAFVTLSWIVVGASPTIPQQLPIGSAFPPAGTTIKVGIVDGTEWESLAHANWVYDKNEGSLEEVTKRKLSALLKASPPQKGKEGHSYGVYADVEYDIERPEGVPDSFSNTFRICRIESLIHFANGAWTVESEPKFVYSPYIGLPLPGLTRIEASVEGVFQIDSSNGVPLDCSLAPGFGNYMGTNIGWFETIAVAPGLTSSALKGTWKVRFGASYGVYDATTGKLVAKSEPPKLKLSITPRVLAAAPEGQKAHKASAPVAFSLTAEGPVGTVIIEYRDGMSGDWKRLATLTNSSGTVEFLDDTSTNSNIRFYRASY